MAEEDDILRTDRWREKSNFVPGLVFGEGGTDIPETRFQVLHGKVYSLMVWSSGETARGEMTLDDLANQLGKRITKEGWYDHAGKYLGNEAMLES